ncbi:Hemerythrin HHE cation binding domain-containing protein [Streptomyces zhaozhouensis]|uniref:Hemerythrin HHE cation binding domain-containing protein n=1 Tax=Streptomyces zhaozhouensis TaxID=1300267 RepID=A0A286DW86_9ACTN|nr:Hemerythrin HHE cation binding domain-containing protein [Streptomyces zhaozhouensis]
MITLGDAGSERAAAARLEDEDIVGVLLAQHARIRDGFSEVRVAEGTRRQEEFDRLRALLAVHETAEEMILRPVAKRVAGKREAEARNEEEHEANQVLAELEKMGVDNAEFDVRFDEFERAVSDHADAEERDEFPSILDSCSQEERLRMGRRLLAAERMAPTHPHPSTAGSPAAQWAVGPFAAMTDRVRDSLRRDGA